MRWVVNSMKWIMLACGGLTCTMIYAAIAPHAALRATFGDTLQGPIAETVVRNWGVLITLIGAMLIYGALVPAARALVLTVAAASKLAFIALVLVHGRLFLDQQAGVAIVSDLIQVTLFLVYLVGVRQRTLPSNDAFSSASSADRVQSHPGL